MDIAIYLQIISIFVAVVAVALPALIAIVGWVFIKNFSERIDNISGEIDQLWDEVRSLSPTTQTNGNAQDTDNKIT